MIRNTYRDINPALYEETGRTDVQSIESREEGEKDTVYLGSVRNGNHLFDYFEDGNGKTWYGTRVMLESGDIVSQEQSIFGCERKKLQYEKKCPKRKYA